MEAVPARVAALAAGRTVALVWRNELGGTTYAAGTDRLIKWAPADTPIDLAREAVRLAWAHLYAPVPRVLDHGRDADGAWLVTAALPGTNAIAPRWVASPALAVAAIGTGLRALHDTLPVASCPFSWSLDDRLAFIRTRTHDPARWHADHRSLTIADARAILASPPPIDQLVVCHGDTCAPNTLLSDDGRFTGHVDLGALGIADRWADLAIATWSTQWNYGPGWEAALLDAYGIGPDDARTRYYRLLWDLGP
jgi:kanamycin kinase